MPIFSELIQQGAAQAWLFIPSAILLGALHGLEPGHSKTMMAAFIVAIRGTVTQAVLLGLAATVSHTLVVWGIALGGMYLWRGLDAESIEPYFQLASGVLIIGIALWMLWRTWAEQRHEQATAGGHGHAHPHAHDHGTDVRYLDTGHGVIAIEIFEDGVPPHWRIRTERGHTWAARDVWLVTERRDGARQSFAFVNRGEYLESVDAIPEPHEFKARISLGHGDHVHDYDLSFEEDPHHDHHHDGEASHGLVVAAEGYQDAHERAHATDIRRRFAGRDVSTWQIIAFGLTGGLIPCPAAITVLLLCLQLKEVTLGFALVLCFSIGLAVTLVTVGAAAALSVRHATSRWSWFGQLARKAPYFSGALIVMVGLYVAYHGWSGLAAQPTPQVSTQVSALP
ncbi:nickel/cobalt efflux transporter [Hydrogenophaga sp.]|uniref:nickel/cobalt efflux transporter n=1 Tax=Hydrogenophaga sp. TaxID=1904254 RepID=UPI001ACF558E|nr:nickel/cobalt efflux transporter [Hydrogenophaga sp.]MBN9369442.1 nickel/cobalt efflux transporter RcnA [Hydrogenophaga sp.]